MNQTGSVHKAKKPSNLQKTDSELKNQFSEQVGIWIKGWSIQILKLLELFFFTFQENFVIPSNFAFQVKFRIIFS